MTPPTQLSKPLEPVDLIARVLEMVADDVAADPDPKLSGPELDAWNAATARAVNVVRSYLPVADRATSTRPTSPGPTGYRVEVSWSDRDGEYVATCPQLPSLSWLAGSRAGAVAGLEALLAEAAADLQP